MRKIFIFVLIIALLFASCSDESTGKPIRETVPPLPHVFVEGKYYYTFSDFEDCDISTENFTRSGRLIYHKTNNLRELSEGEGNFMECDGQSYAFIDDTLYVQIRLESDGHISFRWVEMYPVSEMSSAETSKQSSSDCVPDVSPDPKKDSSSPSHYHSTDTSSNYSQQSVYSGESQTGISTSSTPEYISSGASEQQTEIHYIKGCVVNSLPENSGFPNAALGRESVLKRWDLAIGDISAISEIRVQHVTAKERDLHFEESSAVIENLRAISPKVKPEMGNPATGGSYSVAAYDLKGNEFWRVTLDGYWFVISFGGENASYIFDMEGQDISAIAGIIG